MKPINLNKSLIKKLQQRYIYLGQSNKFYDIRTNAELCSQALNGRYLHLNRGESSITSQILKDANTVKVDGITYYPGKKHGEIDFSGGTYFNTWQQPNNLLPIQTTEKDIERWLEHSRYIIPNDNERNFIFDWMAFIAQNPGIKVNNAILLGGGSRIGKDILFNPLRLVIGNDNINEPSCETLKEKYTDYLRHTKLVIFQEVKTFEGLSIEDKLKPMLAAPPDMLTLRLFAGGFIKCPNLVQAIFMSNHLTSALHISKGDGRYFTVWSPAKRKTDNYYTDFTQWQENGGDALVAGWLLSRDVSHFNPKANAPITEYKLRLQEESKSYLQRELEDMIAAYDYPFDQDIVRASDIPSSLSQKNTKSPVIENALTEIGCYSQSCRRSSGKREWLKLIAVRNVESWREKTDKHWLMSYDSRQKK